MYAVAAANANSKKPDKLIKSLKNELIYTGAVESEHDSAGLAALKQKMSGGKRYRKNGI